LRRGCFGGGTMRRTASGLLANRRSFPRTRRIRRQQEGKIRRADLGIAALIDRDHGLASGHGLEHGNAERLVHRRVEERACARPSTSPHVVVAQVDKKKTRSATRQPLGELLEMRPARPRNYDESTGVSSVQGDRLQQEGRRACEPPITD